MRGWAVALIALVLLVVGGAAAIVGVALSGSSSTSIVDLDVGDCFDLPDESEMDRFETVELIDCDEPHEVEVVGVGELNPDGDLPYPSDDELFALTQQRCAAEVAGMSLDGYGVAPIAPTADTWDGAQGRFTCVALRIGGDPSVGSLTAADDA